MFDFRDIQAASKGEQIRAWAVERALEMTPTHTAESVVYRAAEIEKFVLEGKQDARTD